MQRRRATAETTFGPCKLLKGPSRDASAVSVKDVAISLVAPDLVCRMQKLIGKLLAYQQPHDILQL